jgi:nucleoside 2-deoxyribosyltransferase
MQARDNKDYDTMAKIAKGFLRKDLSLVDRTDFLIANLPYKVPTTGTTHEIINSVNAKKPTMLVCEQGKSLIQMILLNSSIQEKSLKFTRKK